MNSMEVTVSVEKVSSVELVHFLSEVDTYFPPSLSELCKCASLEAWAEKLLKTATFITARTGDGVIVGLLVLYMNNVHECSYVNIVAVVEQMQGRSIGEMLCARALAYSEEKGRVGCRLECRNDNIKAYSLYKKLGFEQEKDKTPDNPDFVYMMCRFD